MKNLLALFLCMNLYVLPVCAVINDDFVAETLDKNLVITPYSSSFYSDDFIFAYINPDLRLKSYYPTQITDEFAELNLSENSYSKLTVDFDEKIPMLSNSSVTIDHTSTDVDNLVPVNVRIKEYLSTRHKINEGDCIEFETVENLTLNNVFYPKSTTLSARVELISKNKSWGVPADLSISNFLLGDIKLRGSIEEVGLNHSIWVYPLACVGSFFGIGLIFIPIRGGHAKIKPCQTYTIYAKIN